jgi:hypothetical protein
MSGGLELGHERFKHGAYDGVQSLATHPASRLITRCLVRRVLLGRALGVPLQEGLQLGFEFLTHRFTGLVSGDAGRPVEYKSPVSRLFYSGGRYSF